MHTFRSPLIYVEKVNFYSLDELHRFNIETDKTTCQH